MKKVLLITYFFAALGVASQATAASIAYLPLGDAGEILVLNTADDTFIGRISGLSAVHGLAGTPGWGFLVAGSYDERKPSEAAAPPKPKGVSQKDHEAHHAKGPKNSSAANDAVSILSVIRLSDRTITRRIEVPGAVHHTAVVPGGKFAISTHPDRDGVSIVDLKAGRVSAVVRTGPQPNYAVVSADGKKVYVSNSGNKTVSEIDTQYWTVRLGFAVGESPEHMVLSPDGSALYVANVDAGSISVVSLPEGVVQDTLVIGGTLHGLDLSDDGKMLFVSGLEQNKLVAIDLVTKKMKSRRLGPSPYHLAAIKSLNKLYVTSAEENKLWVLDQRDLTMLKDLPIRGQGHQIVIMDN